MTNPTNRNSKFSFKNWKVLGSFAALFAVMFVAIVSQDAVKLRSKGAAGDDRIRIGITTQADTATINVRDSHVAMNPVGALAGNTSELRFMELVANGANYTGFKAPNNLAANVIYTLPTADGPANAHLMTNGAGVLSWATDVNFTSINVTGNATVGGNTQLNGTLTVAQNTTLNGALTLAGAATFNSTLAAGATTLASLTVTGITSLNGNVSLGDAAGDAISFNGTANTGLNMGGNSVTNVNNFSGVSLTLTGATNTTGNISQTGATTFSTGTGAVSLNGNTSVTGANTFTVGTGATTLGGALTVAGATTLNGTLTANGAVTVTANISQTGATTFSTGTGAVSINGNTSITGTNTFTVGTGATTLNGTLTANGASTFNNSVSVAGANTLTVGTGATTLGGTLAVTGNATFTANVTVNGNTTLGNANTDTVTAVAAAINFTGNNGAGVGTAVSFNDGVVGANAHTFGVGGDDTLAITTTTLTVTGASTYNGTSTFTGNINQTGGTTFSTGTGAISLNGAVAAASSVTVTGATTLNGTLTSNNTSTFTGSVSLGDGDVGDNVSITDAQWSISGAGAASFVTLTTSGLATLNSASVTTTLAVGGNTTLTGDLAVNGGDITSTAAFLNITTTTPGSVISITDGTNTLMSITDAGTTGNVLVTGTLTATGNTTVNGTTTLNGVSTINSTLTVTGSTTLQSTLQVNGAASFSGDTTLGDAAADLVTVNSADIRFRGVADPIGGVGTVVSFDDGGNGLVRAHSIGLAVGSNDTLTINVTTINSTGNQTVSGNLTVNGDTTLGNGGGTIAIGGGTDNVSITDPDWSISAAGAASFTSSTVSGASSVAGTATFTGNVNLGDGGAADDIVITDANWSITGAGVANFAATTVASITVNGDATLGNGTDTITIGSAGATDDVIITDAQWSITGAGAATLTSATVSGNATLGSAAASTITIGNVLANVSITDTQWSIDGTGNASFGGTLAVTGTSTLTGLLTANGGAQVNGTLGSTGATSLATGGGATTVGGTLAVTGITTLTGALNANGGAAVTGTLSATGATSLATGGGATTVGGTLAVTGSTTMTGTLAVQNVGGIGVGLDAAPLTANTAGRITFVSAGDNAFQTVIIAGTQTTGNITYTLPVTAPAATPSYLTSDVAGQWSWTTTTVPADSLDFTEFKQNMLIDDDPTTIELGAKVLKFNDLNGADISGTVQFEVPNFRISSKTISVSAEQNLIDVSWGTVTSTATFANERFFKVAAPNLSPAALTTITTAATFYVGGSPANTGAGTITDSYSIWVDSGLSRYDDSIYGADGTALLPMYTFEADRNTGIYRPGADDLGFTTAGVEGMRVSNLHNVSIDTSANDGAAKLEIQHDTATTPDLPTILTSGYVGSASATMLDFSGTWNNAATTFTALKVNITETGFAAASLLMDLQNTGATQFNVDNTGRVYSDNGAAATPAYSFITDPDTGIYRAAANQVGVAANGTSLATIQSGANSTGLVELQEYNVTPDTITITGSYASQRYFVFGAPTLNGGGNTVTDAATVYIAGAPSGTATITNAYGLWVVGNSRFDGDVTINGNLTVTLNTNLETGVTNNILTIGSTSLDTINILSGTTTYDDTGAAAAHIIQVGVAGGNDSLTIRAGNGDGSAGSAAAPTYSFSTDTDNGMYLSGANLVSFATDGQQRVELGNDASGSLVNVDALDRVSGTGINLRYSAATVLAGTTTGAALDLSTNVTSTDQSINGISMTLPGASNSAAGPVIIQGLDVNANALTTTGGTTIFNGAEVSVPNLTETAGSLTGKGVKVETGTITGAADVVGFELRAAATTAPAGATLTGLSILALGANGAGTENAISVAAGWDNVLVLGGNATITGTGTFRAEDGTAGAPSYSFVSDIDTGLFSAGANILGVTIAGTERGRVTSTGLKMIDGSATDPSFSFTADTDTGLFRVGANTIGFAANGGETARMDNTGLFLINGTAANPAYSFTADTNTGIFSVGADDLGFATGGVQRVDISTTQVVTTLQVMGPDGSAANPTYGFTTDLVQDTGFFHPADGIIGVSSDGTERGRFSNSGLTLINGSAAAPSYAFTADTNTGLYSSAADVLGIATGGAEAFTVGGALTIAGDPTIAANKVAVSSTGFIFEGASADTNEGLLTSADVSADRTWTLPNQSGTLLTTNAAGTTNNATLRFDTGTNNWQENTNLLATAAGAVTANGTITAANTAGIFVQSGGDSFGLNIQRASARNYQLRSNDDGAGAQQDATRPSWAVAIGEDATDNFNVFRRPAAGAYTSFFNVTSGGNANINSGGLQTAGTTRLTNGGALQNITGYSQTASSFTYNTSVNTGNMFSIISTGSLVANMNMVVVNGSGITDNGFTTTGINMSGTPGADTAIAADANWTNVLTVGGTSIINGTGNINNATIGVTAAAAGNFTSIGATTAGTGAFTTLSSTGATSLGNGTNTVTINSSGAANITGAAATAWNIGANTLTVTSSFFNTTGTGINTTPIGATTPSTGAFTTLSSTGVTALGNGTNTVTINSSGAANITGAAATTWTVGANTLAITSSNFTVATTGKIGVTNGTGTSAAGAATINTPAGRVTVGAGDGAVTAFVITDSTVTAASHVFVVASSGFQQTFNVVPGAGTFTVTFAAAPGAGATFDFFVIN